MEGLPPLPTSAYLIDTPGPDPGAPARLPPHGKTGRLRISAPGAQRANMNLTSTDQVPPPNFTFGQYMRIIAKNVPGIGAAV